MRLLPPAYAVATAFVLGCAGTVLSIPDASASTAVLHRVGQRAEQRPVRATLTFVKNRHDPFRSTLTWRLYRYGVPPVGVAPEPPAKDSPRSRATRPAPKATKGGGPRWYVAQTRTWRAGSGLGGRAGKNSCLRNRGWLPNGVYAPVQHDRYDGSYINGRVFYLGAHRCGNGTVRQSLFIHTETGVDNRQCRNARGDQHCRWERAWNDYRSNGCIKLSPADLRALTRLYHRHFAAGVRYDARRFQVRVIG